MNETNRGISRCVFVCVCVSVDSEQMNECSLVWHRRHLHRSPSAFASPL